MKNIAAITVIPFLLVLPASAQHSDHSPTPPPTSQTGADPQGMDDMPEMSWPQSVPPKDGKSESTPGMDHSQMDHGQMDHSKMGQMPGMPGMDEQVGQEAAPPPPEDHAADRLFDPAVMAAARSQLRKEVGGGTFSMVMLNLAEYQVRNGEDGYRWEGEAWFGGDINRVVFKSEGEGGIRSGVDTAEIQALYSRAIGPYFDLQAGVRQDLEPIPRRTYFALGVEGLAPYWFETNAALFLSTEGDLVARLEGTYDFRLTQRLILQPRAELNLSAQDIPETDIGAGLSNLELGLRLRYEVRREFAPYIGVSFDRKFGGTADFARQRGDSVEQVSFVVGVRAWF